MMEMIRYSKHIERTLRTDDHADQSRAFAFYACRKAPVKEKWI